MLSVWTRYRTFYVLESFYVQNSTIMCFYGTPPHLLSLSLSFTSSAKQQPARSVIVSGNVRCTTALSWYDVIWAKGCVNTALTLVLDLSIGLGWRTEKRIVLD